jgi:hypothetical protein
VLCVDVFRKSLEWGLVLSRRRGGWEFLLGLCAHHGWLYLCYGMALSLTLSLFLLVTPPFQKISKDYPLGPFTLKGTKSLIDYHENCTSTTLKNHQ